MNWMKGALSTIFIIAFVITQHAQNKMTSMDSVSQSLGLIMGSNLKSQGFTEVNAEVFASAMAHALNEEPSQKDLQAANAIVTNYLRQKQDAKFEPIKKEGEAFLAANKEKDGVQVTESGLQYMIIEEGNGPTPSATDKVEVHYHGTLLDGTVFDSSVDRGKSISFPVNGVIQGWQEALQMMPVGSKWKLFIPYDLAYGERGAGESIKPYATLIFEVELLGIE